MLIKYDEVREEVRDEIGQAYVGHLRRSNVLLEDWMKHSGHEKGLRGNIRKIDEQIFQVNVMIPEDMTPGRIRKELMQVFYKVDFSHDEKNQLDYLCYVIGAQWTRVLAQHTELYRWVLDKDSKAEFMKDPPDWLKISDPGVARQIRLAWVGRRA